MKFCDEKIQKHLLNGGKIKKISDDRHLEFRAVKFISNELCYADMPNEHYRLFKNDLTTDEWEIIKSEYDWDKIIKDKVLCVFSDDKDFKYKVISTLNRRSDNADYYLTYQRVWYKYCKPFNPEEFNIVKDLKEYEK